MASLYSGEAEVDQSQTDRDLLRNGCAIEETSLSFNEASKFSKVESFGPLEHLYEAGEHRLSSEAADEANRQEDDGGLTKERKAYQDLKRPLSKTTVTAT